MQKYASLIALALLSATTQADYRPIAHYTEHYSAGQKVVYELNTQDVAVQRSTLLNITNHLNTVKQADVILLIHGDAVFSIQQGGGVPSTKDTLKKLVAQGLKIRVCDNSLKYRNLDHRELQGISEANITEAGMPALVEYQMQGYHYVRP